ncbi:MAG: nuclear transport factor 2 family protein [Mongoliitalea sp.]
MYKIILSIGIFMVAFSMASAQNDLEKLAEQLAQAQLDAYNNRDLDAFLIPYADDVKVFEFPDQLQYIGKERMAEIYGRMFVRTPDLHCHLVHRMVMGNTVIDQELVTIDKNQPPMRAIAIYKIANKKIAEVYFIYDRN